MNRVILLPNGKKEEIENVFKASKMQMSRALNFKSFKSGKQRIIRAAAIQRGGFVVDYDLKKVIPYKEDENYYPDVTLEQDIDVESGVWKLPFPNGVKIIMDTEIKTVTIIYPNRSFKFIPDVTTLDQLKELQKEAEAWKGEN